MPHIAITMIPGRDRKTKKEDLPKEDWAEHMENFPEDIIYTDNH